MGWERHNGRGEAAAKKNTVRVAIRYDGRSHYALKIAIGREIVQRMGLYATTTADFFWGEGGHQGWVRIAPTVTGRYAIALHRSAQGEKASLMMVVGGLPKWIVREKKASVVARFTINIDKELEIKLPKDFITGGERRKVDTVPHLGALRDAA